MMAGDPRERLHAWLHGKGMPTSPTPWRTLPSPSPAATSDVVTPKSYALYFKDRAFEEAVREVFGRPLRIKLSTGEAAARPAPISLATPPKADAEDEVTGRALANPGSAAFPRSLRRRSSQSSQPQGVDT